MLFRSSSVMLNRSVLFKCYVELYVLLTRFIDILIGLANLDLKLVCDW